MLSISNLTQDDVYGLSAAFYEANWEKPISLFEEYLQESQSGKRVIWVAKVGQKYAGYVTLLWKSQYKPFSAQNIPEIMDLNVLPTMRNQGIGSTLLNTAEEEASHRCNIVGLGVGLYSGADGGYGAAQKLYIRNGYTPDRKGATYNYQPAQPGKDFPLDDDLLLWFTKEIVSRNNNI